MRAGRAGDGAAADVPLPVVLARHRRRRPHAPAAAAGRPRRRRRGRRRRLHGTVDRLLPAARRPGAADRGAGAEIAGFGASRPQRRMVLGALPGVASARLASGTAATAALALQRAMRRRSTRWVGSPTPRASTATSQGRHARWRRGRRCRWTGRAPRSPTARRWGIGEDDLALARPRRGPRAGGGRRRSAATYTPHCAAIHPARLVRGLARAVERHGVPIYERTPVSAIGPAGRHRRGGRVRADVVVRATEGFTARVAGPAPRRRADLLADDRHRTAARRASWDAGRLERRETFTDGRHLIIYGQRTADDRIAFGGRGAPYHFGSRIRPGFDRDDGVFAELRTGAARTVPGVARGRDHPPWGGPLGVPRDWWCSVGPRPGDRAGLGRRLRRRRRVHDQPGRPHTRRPRHRHATRS